MPAEDDIVQRIVLDGDKAAIAQFQAVGTAGEAAFTRINSSATKTGKVFGEVGNSFSSVLSNLRQTGHDSEEAAKGLDTATKSGTSFATTLRLLGRATGTRELSRLGRTLGVLGRAFTVAAPAILGAALGKVAAVGSDAAQKFATLAAETKNTTDDLGDLQAAGTGVGLSLEDAGKSFKAINDAAKQAAENVDKNAVEFRHLSEALADTKAAGDVMVEGFRKIRIEGENALRDFQQATAKINDAATASGENLTKGLRDIQEQRDAINGISVSKAEQRSRQLRNLDEQEKKLKEDAVKGDAERLQQQIKLNNDFAEGQRKRELELVKLNQEIAKNARAERDATEALAKAHVEAERNATSFEKLGINTREANGKLKATPKLLLELAGALEKIKDPLERQSLEFQIVADGIDRAYLPALRRGREEFAKLQAENKTIQPPFTPAQIKIADDFAVATRQVGAAFSALIDELGIAIAPDLIPFFNKLRDILVEIKPGVIEFVKTVSAVLGPALTAIASVVQNIIVPAFRGIIGILDGVAEFINKTFKTNLTGIELFAGAVLTIGVAFLGVPGAITAVLVALGLLAAKFKENKVLIFGLVALFGGLAFALGVVPLAIGAVITAFLLLASVVDWKKIGAGAVTLWGQIKQGGSDAVQFIIDKFNTVVTFFTDLWTFISTKAQDAWIFVSDQALIGVNFVIGIFTGLRDKVNGVWDAIKTKIINVWESVKDKVRMMLGAAGAGEAGAGAQAKAGGGQVRGAGTGTSDSVLMWGSNGEWMMRAAAVKKYGLGLMQSINSLRFNPEGFNMGGLISFNAPQPRMRYAEGGAIKGGGGTLNLSIDGQQFTGLRASSETMKDLTRYATDRKIRSAGRKPNWAK